MKEEKYTIVKNGVDDYTLKYGETEIKLHSTVGLTMKIQNVLNEARRTMIIDLASQGQTLNDLVKEKNKDGKKIVDTSNADALENLYVEREYSRVFEECIKEMTGKSFVELIQEIGLLTEAEGEKFGEEIGGILSGNFPSWWKRRKGKEKKQEWDNNMFALWLATNLSIL